MKLTALALLMAGAVACGSADTFDEAKYEADVSQMQTNSRICVSQATNVTDLSVCSDMLDREADKISKQLEEGYYGDPDNV